MRVAILALLPEPLARSTTNTSNPSGSSSSSGRDGESGSVGDRGHSFALTFLADGSTSTSALGRR